MQVQVLFPAPNGASLPRMLRFLWFYDFKYAGVMLCAGRLMQTAALFVRAAAVTLGKQTLAFRFKNPVMDGVAEKCALILCPVYAVEAPDIRRPAFCIRAHGTAQL